MICGRGLSVIGVMEGGGRRRGIEMIRNISPLPISEKNKRGYWQGDCVAVRARE